MYTKQTLQLMSQSISVNVTFTRPFSGGTSSHIGGLASLSLHICE